MLGRSMRQRIARLGSALTLALVVVGSCHDSATGPDKASVAQGATSGLFGGGSSSPSLLTCPTNESQSTSSLIGVLGGTVSLGGTTALVPAGILTGQTLEMAIPAGNYVEVDLSVDGGQHANFDPSVVTVTLDYSRCNRTNILTRPLTVWNIDESSKALLEQMPSVDNKLTQTITFTTTHFSGFAVAY